MGLSFLTPAFFLGALAVAVPILVHLIHREKRETVPFPSLMFLRRIPYRTMRRQKIRHWMLFLMRVAAALLLVLAFARPFLTRSSQAAVLAAGGGQEIVILLDRSYSMGYGNRWDRAVSAALDAAENVGPNDRATVILFADRAEAMNRPTSNKNELKAAIQSARPAAAVTRYAPALKLARKFVEESKLGRHAVVLITDFQKIGWDGQPSVLEEAQLPEGTTLTRVDVSEKETSNLAVTSVVLDRDYLSDRERLVVSARVTNKGAKPFKNVDVAIELNDRALQVKPVSLEPNTSTTVEFAPLILPEGISHGTVRAAADDLPIDNQFHFVIAPGQALPVLVLEGADGRAQRSLYLKRALALGDRPPFRSVSKRASELRASDLASARVVVVNDAPYPGAEALRLLKGFVERGGGAIIALGETASPSGWQAAGKDFLPGAPGAVIDRSADWGGALAYLNHSHPVFEIFGAPRSGDFSAAQFFRYRTLTVAEAPASAAGVQSPVEVLARFDDGGVALAERKLGKGRVLVWTSTLDTLWSDLGLQPVFLPFVHQLVKHAAGFTEARPWYTVGEVLDLSHGAKSVEATDEEGGEKAGTASEAAKADDDPAELVATTPSGQKSYVGSGKPSRFVILDEQGFYQLRPLGGSTARPQSLAVNLDFTESDLASLDPEELSAAIVPRGGAGNSAAAAAELGPEDRERRQAFWWYLLVGAFVLLVAETALSNRLSRAAR